MAEIILGANVLGEDTIDAELKTELEKVSTDVANIMVQLGQFIGDTLKKHIDQDVYAAYTPKVYPRRSENPRFGTPLNDVWANSFPILETRGGHIGGVVGLNYLPTGTHTGTTADLDSSSSYYDADNPRPIKPNPANGNQLIRRIETGRGYDWNAYPGKREFWQNTVKELVDNGELERELYFALIGKGYDVLMDTGVIRDAADGEY